jgi:hypothetical protein
MEARKTWKVIAQRNHADHDRTVLAIRSDDDVRHVDLGTIDVTHDTFLPCDSAQCERDNNKRGFQRAARHSGSSFERPTANCKSC